jgi:hypothetical protein
MNSKVGNRAVLYVSKISKITQDIRKIIKRLIEVDLVESDFASDLIMKNPESDFLMQVER